jgi:hypothetical protein
MAIANGLKVFYTGDVAFASWLIGLKAVGFIILMLIFALTAKEGILLSDSPAHDSPTSVDPSGK